MLPNVLWNITECSSKKPDNRPLAGQGLGQILISKCLTQKKSITINLPRRSTHTHFITRDCNSTQIYSVSLSDKYLGIIYILMSIFRMCYCYCRVKLDTPNICL